MKTPMILVLAIVLCVSAVAAFDASTSPLGNTTAGCVNSSYVYRSCDGQACTTSGLDAACCPNSLQYCVYEGKCYMQNTLWLQNKDYFPNGMFCFKLVQGFDTTTLPRWLDCDGGEGAFCSNRSFCNFKAAASGEEGVGKYDYLGKRECCGDDEKEFYIEGADGTSACCASPGRMVEVEKCITVVNNETAVETPATSIEPTTTSVEAATTIEATTTSVEPVPEPAKPVGFFQRILNWFKRLFTSS